MFFEKLVRFCRGYVIIRAEGKFPERFLNVCANREILITDVKYLSKTALECLISLKAYKETTSIAAKTFVDIEIVSKGGLPVLLQNYKKRTLLLLCPALFVIALFVLNLFVWDIEITGCDKVLPKTIEENLLTLGVKPGVLRYKIDEKSIKSKILTKMPELSWFWLDKHGSKLVVNVRESTPPPEIFDKNDYCNIIALKDGIIDSVVVKNGTLMAEPGKTVRKNDILVSGLMLSERNIEPRKIQADGEIYARVWYEVTKNFPLSEEQKKETGNVSKKREIKLFGIDFVPFWYKEPPFTDYITETSVFEPSIFGKYIGIKTTTNLYKEYIKEIVPLTEKTVVASAVTSILEEIDGETVPNSKRVNYNSSYVKNDDNTVSVTVICEYIENIAKKVRVG